METKINILGMPWYVASYDKTIAYYLERNSTDQDFNAYHDKINLPCCWSCEGDPQDDAIEQESDVSSSSTGDWLPSRLQ